MKIVGNCPKCGNPIYGQRVLAEGEQPTIKRSCACITVTMSLPRTQQPSRYPNVQITPPFATDSGGTISPNQWRRAWNATSNTWTVLPPNDEPDSDAGMVT